MRYDVAVVGGGTAGCVIAARLSEDPRRQVLLLEAGPDYTSGQAPPDVAELTDTMSTQVWSYSGRAHHSRPDQVPYPAGRIMGGSSAINGGVFLRGIRADFDVWASAAGPPWSYEQVLPYFFRSETDLDCDCDFHGRRGPVVVRRLEWNQMAPAHRAFALAAEAAGLPPLQCIDAPDARGVGIVPFNSVDGRRQSTKLAYLDPVRDRPNLTIRPDVAVDRVLVEGGRATGVEYRAGTERVTVRAGGVVVSGGTMGSPLLLQRSGVGPRDVLDAAGVDMVAELPGVGRNLRDHPYVPVFFAIPKAALTTAQRSGLCTRLTTPTTRGADDVNLFAFARVAVAPWAPTDPSATETAAAIGCMVNNALAVGTVGLQAQGKPPAIDFNCLGDNLDLTRLREAVRFVMRLLDAPEMRALGGPLLSPADGDLGSDATVDRWLAATVRTAQHPAGTCAMGAASDPLAVLDGECRVRGIGGLRVIDASSMPDVVSVNSNASTIMLAERAVEFMR